jgi:hypothetical protein
MFWDGGLNSRGAHEPTRARVFYGASICPIFGIARPRTRRLHALHTRAIVQPSASMCPFRLRAWSSPCVRIHRLGAEILPMESRRTSPNGADPIQRPSPRQLGCSSICIKKIWCDAATRPSDAFRYGYAPGDPALRAAVGCAPVNHGAEHCAPRRGRRQRAATAFSGGPGRSTRS